MDPGLAPQTLSEPRLPGYAFQAQNLGPAAVAAAAAPAGALPGALEIGLAILDGLADRRSAWGSAGGPLGFA